ncbi:hypothetical protein [Actinomadura sp. 21ATH]|uniref:hypothetical protein n=1 Tax=Actinomadura sp. 21ATH TaxID=1735444 RepID=UPI0035BF4005
MMDHPQHCPVCGTPPPPRRTGRPAVWCSTSCRQTAYRARHSAARAQAAATQASDRIAGAGLGQVQAAERALTEAVLAMCELPHDAALADDDNRWESALARRTRALAHAATAVAELADQHARAHAGYRHARAVFRHPDLVLPARDETGPTGYRLLRVRDTLF